MVQKRAGGTRVQVFDLEVGGEKLVVMSLPARGAVDVMAGLSAAECEVARDAASGLSNAAIAKKRKRSARTIANQLASIYRKLDVSSRAALTARLLRDR